MSEWRPIETAQPNKDVIVLDNHGFVHRMRRMRRKDGGGWVMFQSRLPIFVDAELQGWIPFSLPSPPDSRHE